MAEVAQILGTRKVSSAGRLEARVWMLRSPNAGPHTAESEPETAYSDSIVTVVTLLAIGSPCWSR